MTAPTHAFLPWLRRGAARGLTAPVTITPAGRAALAVTVDVNGAPTDAPLALFGPGDVTAIDPGVVRTVDPPRGSREAEPYAFAAIELALPDLPWLLSPAVADGEGRLEPWLALVVVRADASAIVRGGQGAPRLELANAAELPPPAEAWAWAHVQVAGGLDQPLDAILAAAPHRVTARVICPRRLDPGVAWRAALVPRYTAGRAAGLGAAAPAEPLAFAWDPASTAPVALPAYYDWEFSTAADADFETLAQRIVGRALPPEVGRLPVDFRAPGAGVRGIDADLTVDGALVAFAALDPDPLPPAAADAVADLAATIDRAVDPTVVTAPLYGGAQAGTTTVPAADGWLRELNLDPGLRAAAGLGVEAVRRDQEALVAAAWDQYGELRDANRRLSWLALAAEVAGALHRKHFARLSAPSLLAITAPAHARLRLAPNAPLTLHAEIRARVAIASAVAPVVRRALRPTGRVMRAVRSVAIATDGIGRRVLGLIPVVTFTPASALVTFARVFGALGGPPAFARLGPDRLTAAAIGSAHVPPAFFAVDEHGQGAHLPIPPLPFPIPVPSDGHAFRTAAVGLFTQLDRTRALAARPRGLTLGPAIGKAELLAATAPALAFQAVVDTRLVTPADTPPRGALDPVRGTPRYPQPTMPALQAISATYILPGLDRVPANTSSLAAPNPRFVEAFLLGMNHELERELIWREFPAQRGATYFHRFWDTRGRIGGPTDDIGDIAGWTAASALGEHAPTADAAARTVLVIRADLLRRFPGVMVYAVPPTSPGGPPNLDPAAELHPVFRGALEPDALFAGFEIPRTAAVKWFFVLQQRPGAPRFGLDAPVASPPPPVHRNDLSWSHMPAGALHAITGGALDHHPLDDVETGEHAIWGRNAADMAWATLQLPVRLIVPGARMVPS